MELDSYIKNIKNIINAPIRDVKQIGRITIKKKCTSSSKYSNYHYKKKYIVDTEENSLMSRINIINGMLDYTFPNHDESNESNEYDQLDSDGYVYDSDESIPELIDDSHYDSDSLESINNDNNSGVTINSDESDEIDEDLIESLVAALTESLVALMEDVD